MTSHPAPTRLTVALGAVVALVAAALLSVVPASAAHAATTASGVSATGAMAQRSCFTIKRPGDTQSHLECFEFIKQLNTPYQVGYRDSLVNKTSRTAKFECEASQSSSFSWGASVKVSASIKASVFASIEAEVSANVQQTMTSGTAVRAGVSVPPRSTVFCDRVVYTPRYLVRKCSIYQGGGESCGPTTWQAPSRRGWVLRDAP